MTRKLDFILFYWLVKYSAYFFIIDVFYEKFALDYEIFLPILTFEVINGSASLNKRFFVQSFYIHILFFSFSFVTLGELYASQEIQNEDLPI
jgi:hypothetical protein